MSLRDNLIVGALLALAGALATLAGCQVYEIGHGHGVKEERRRQAYEIDGMLLDGWRLYDPAGNVIQRWEPEEE